MAYTKMYPSTGMCLRVSKLLEERGISGLQLHKALPFGSCNNSTYDRLMGRKQFQENEIVAICKYLNVSADYLLLGIEDKKMPKKAIRSPIPPRCPVCLGRLSNLQKFCNNCGQALMWDDGRMTN